MPSTATQSGSDQSENRSLVGILVHVLALFTSFVGPAIVYAVSDHEFTRKNARNALNWHLSLTFLWTFGIFVMIFVSLFAADDLTFNGEAIDPLPVPPLLETVFTFVAIILVLAMAVTVLATFVYAVVGTLKAVSGSVWSYPGAFDILGRLHSDTRSIER